MERFVCVANACHEGILHRNAHITATINPNDVVHGRYCYFHTRCLFLVIVRISIFSHRVSRYWQNNFFQVHRNEDHSFITMATGGIIIDTYGACVLGTSPLLAFIYGWVREPGIRCL